MMNLLKINEMANKLEKWAERVEPKLPEHIGHISFYGSLKKALDNLPDLAFTWLQSRMPEQLESIQKDFDGLYEKAKEVDWQRSESPGAGANILKCQAQAAAKNLSQKLRLIVKMTQENLATEKPAGTEPDTTPAKRGMFKRMTVWIFKKTWHLIVAIIVALIAALIAAIVIDIFADLGWLDRIKAFIYRILQLK